MKCPLCDDEISDLVKHFGQEHKEIAFVCTVCNCGIGVQPEDGVVEIRATLKGNFYELGLHCHSELHLYNTGKIQEKIKNLTGKTEILKQKLSEQTKKTIKAEQDKIEILQAGYARR